MTRFSIIIPLYNCAEYIQECIDSILENGYDNNLLQIIVINDGSTDESLLKLKKYKNKISVHSKDNGNWGSVVNYVKNKVALTGDYITILDADDKYLPGFFEAVSKNSGEDIVVSNFYKWSNKKTKKMYVIWGKSRVINNINVCRSPICHPHGKLYRKELFLKLPNLMEKVYFLDGYVYHYLLNQSKSVYFISKAYAYWRCDRIGNSTNMELTEMKAKQFANHFQLVSDCGSGVVLKATIISYSFYKLLKKYNLKINLHSKKTNIEWFPFFLRIVFLLVFKLLPYTKNVIYYDENK